MKNCLLRSFQALLVFSLAFTLTNCGNLDNPLEELSGGSGSGGSSTINATDIKLDQTLKVFKLGDAALTIKATVTPTDATDKTVTWESKDPTIASVENGVVTPVGVGITTITAKSGELSATCEVFVGNEVALGESAYEAKNYDILKGNMGANSLTIPADIKVVFNGVKTTKQIICQGTATIILADASENEVTVSTNGEAGIKIGGDGTTLTIEAETAGTGKLTAKGGGYGAGIGTNLNSTGGNIVINGGTVNATGGDDGAGIGTGVSDPTNTCGTITINGGTVTATGGVWAAGIGTGFAFMNSTNTCVAITINGGTVTAQGNSSGAGIGTGYANASSGDATAECGNIIIAGGTVNAKGGNYGAGIGTGVTCANLGYTASQTCGAITIGTGVTSVIATMGSGAPNSIGVGYKVNFAGTENQTCGTITIGGDATTYAAGVAASPFTYPVAP
jgi:hypothetical protein